VTWNTGEVLTVVNDGTYLAGTINPGPNGSGALQGLIGSQKPATTTQLYGSFADSWRVTNQTSLFDYPPGEGTANFTNSSFPQVPITLDDLPVTIVAAAAQAVAAGGITGPGAAAAVEFDFIASGGDPSVIANEQDLFQGLSTSPATITESSPPPP